jgi:hypothetical protein
MTGTMFYFNEEKDVGAIKSDEGERLEVHRSGFVPGHAPVGRCSGLPVVFSLSEDGLAVDVAMVEEANPRRARRHTKR